MEFFGLLGILLLIGAILGWLSFFKVRSLESQLKQLKSELQLLRRSIVSNKKDSSQPAPLALDTPAPTITSSEPTKESQEQQEIIQEPSEMESVVESKPETPETKAPEPEPPEQKQADWDYDRIESPIPPSQEKPKSYVRSSQFVDPDEMFLKFKENWMLWIGGISVALAGIFLARYAIQQGVLGPVGRITAGIITGLSLHVAAEYLRRKLAENHATFAMLAAGGSITLFATLLAALHYYQMFSPMVVFVVLAIVAVATMWLSMIHGPILAAMGMIGAYVLPIMVSTGSGEIVIALTYSLIITGSILLLLQYVNRTWLWYGMMAGSLFWWLVSLDGSKGDIWREWYLAILAYGVISVMNRDWFLQRLVPFATKDKFYALSSKHLSLTDRWLAVSMLLILVAQQISVLATASSQLYFPAWIPLAIIVMLAARNNAYLSIHAWLAVIGSVATLLFVQFNENAISLIEPVLETHQSDFLTNMLLIALVFSGMALFNSRQGVVKACWTAMALVTPILVLITTYLCVPSLISDGYWTMTGVLVGALYIFIATVAKSKAWDKAWEVWLYLSGHFAYSFAAVTFFDNGTLTLALAVQAISLAVIIKRYELPQLSWLLKLVTTITVLRLSANPWLIDYPTTEHWTIWTYGGSFVAVMMASYLLGEMVRLRRWLEGAGMHLLVLAIWVECRYYLYDGAVFQSQYT
ncbi:MAG: DUF2339 domain-containing protein, partial [Gammaproteobacteria bacterium]|nr:DUF2339 domain-containing protein [Gammaproteobacteria bacterium]NNJ71870.1 DUF2339 domain-containing protein [Enterobacterales bacterium]